MGYAQQAVDKMKKPPRVLDGVKVPKYARPAARPISADVVAVNASHGSEIVANRLLDEYNKEAMKFVEARGTPLPMPRIYRSVEAIERGVEELEALSPDRSTISTPLFGLAEEQATERAPISPPRRPVTRSMAQTPSPFSFASGSPFSERNNK